MRALHTPAAPYLTDPLRRAWALAQMDEDARERTTRRRERRAFAIAIAHGSDAATRWLRHQETAGPRVLPPDQAVRAWVSMDHWWHGAALPGTGVAGD